MKKALELALVWECEGAWEGPLSRRNLVCVVVLSSDRFVYSTFRGVPWLETRRRLG